MKKVTRDLEDSSLTISMIHPMAMFLLEEIEP
jgi:hypothetical protein